MTISVLKSLRTLDNFPGWGKMPAYSMPGAGNVALGVAKVWRPMRTGRHRTRAFIDLTSLERILHNSFVAAEDTYNDENAKDRRLCAKKT